MPIFAWRRCRIRAHGGLPLHAWDSSLGNTSEEAASLGLFEHIVFLDAPSARNPPPTGPRLFLFSFQLRLISLIDFTNPKNTRNVTVEVFSPSTSFPRAFG